MRISKEISLDDLNSIINHADKICKEFDEESNCKEFLIDKIHASNTTSFRL